MGTTIRSCLSLWDAVQKMLSSNAVKRSSHQNHKAPFLLTGKVYDETGDQLYQSQADKKGKRYRYYVSKRLVHEAHRYDDGWRLPARNLESIVISTIKNLLGDRRQLMDMFQTERRQPNEIQRLFDQAQLLSSALGDGEHLGRLKLLQSTVHRIDLSQDKINIALDRKALATALNAGENLNDKICGNVVNISVPVTLRRRGVEAKLMIVGMNGKQPQPDKRLCRLIAIARYWYDQLASGTAGSIREIAKRDKVVESEVTRILPLAFLSPRLVDSVLEGEQPDGMSVERLKRLSPLPGDWKAQANLINNLR